MGNTCSTMACTSKRLDCVAGLHKGIPAIMSAFWDSRFTYGNPYALWALDMLHHINLGISKRLGVDLLKVGPLQSTEYRIPNLVSYYIKLPHSRFARVDDDPRIGQRGTKTGRRVCTGYISQGHRADGGKANYPIGSPGDKLHVCNSKVDDDIPISNAAYRTQRRDCKHHQRSGVWEAQRSRGRATAQDTTPHSRKFPRLPESACNSRTAEVI